MQVAHFLEADLQPWAAALAAALFSTLNQAPAAAGSSAAAEAAGLWWCLEELAPLHEAVDTVLRASRLPLPEQLPRTPAAWRPAVIGSHVEAGALTLDSATAAACCDAMHLSLIHI